MHSCGTASRGKAKCTEEGFGGGGEGQHPVGEWAVPWLVLWDHVLPGKPLIAQSEIITRPTLSCLPVMS